LVKKPKIQAAASAKADASKEQTIFKSHFIFWNDIKEALTGYARIIHYRNTSSVFKRMDDANEVFGDKVHF